MSTDTSETLLGIAERECFGPLVQAHDFMRTQVEMAMRLDAIELELVFHHLAGGGVLMPILQVQGMGLAAQATMLLGKLDERLDQFRACVSTPPRTASLGRSWLKEISTIDEMIQSAEKLTDLPSWQGSAAEAHLAVVPEQVEAMRGLRSQAVTAADAVMAVGALQNLIFQSCTLYLIAAATQVEVHHPSGYVPQWLYKRTAGAVGLLTRVLVEIDKQITGEGTWLESALELSRGLEEATADPETAEWPKAVEDQRGKKGKKHGKKSDDEDKAETDESAETEPAGTAEEPGSTEESEPEVTTSEAEDTSSEPEAAAEPVAEEPQEPEPEPSSVADPVPTPPATAQQAPIKTTPVPEPVVIPEPEPEVVLPSFAEAGIQQPYQPVDPVVTEQAWEQIAAERALAEEALFPSPTPRPADPINGPLGITKQLY